MSICADPPVVWRPRLRVCARFSLGKEGGRRLGGDVVPSGASVVPTTWSLSGRRVHTLGRPFSKPKATGFWASLETFFFLMEFYEIVSSSIF